MHRRLIGKTTAFEAVTERCIPVRIRAVHPRNLKNGEHDLCYWYNVLLYVSSSLTELPLLMEGYPKGGVVDL